MTPEDIKWLHVEPSSKCNAWCPACPRNLDGYGLVEGLVEEDLSVSRFEAIISQLPNLHAVQLCGNYGDPIASKYILEIINIAKQRNLKIQIHTNGSLRTADWWHDLGTVLCDTDHNIWFGIDGLESIHEIYRQGTSYKKIIENAQAFIKAGGFATWQFIPYAHNEHQIKECIKTSQQLGFKKFKLIKFMRDKKTVRHYRTGDEFDLLPPNKIQPLIKMPNSSTNIVKLENCMHMSQPSIYLAASGELSSCCYFGLEKGVDTINEVLYNKVDLNHKTCRRSCG